MAIDYPSAQKTYRRFKSLLTRAKNTGDSVKILIACEAFFAYYDRPDSPPFPDDWHRWNIARDDARMDLQRKAYGL